MSMTFKILKGYWTIYSSEQAAFRITQIESVLHECVSVMGWDENESAKVVSEVKSLLEYVESAIYEKAADLVSRIAQIEAALNDCEPSKGQEEILKRCKAALRTPDAVYDAVYNAVSAEAQRWEERFKTAQADANRYRQLLIALTHQIDIGTFVDEYGHQAKMLLAYRKAREALWPNP